ncbi:hypothetical protein ABDZ30_14615 [Aeromonas veronii]|jgi:hypothetical protein|uniref:hypothetical protein n=1 Tax=Aeromonas veronii TaxID=654 RepID=UPI0031FC3172
MTKLTAIAIYLAAMFEAFIRAAIKAGLMIAAVSLWWLLAEFFKGGPIDPLINLISTSVLSIMLGLVLALITAIKWAWRKRQARKGG